MSNELKKRTLTPAEVEEIYGIPRGSLANMRWAKRGPRYYKRPGGRSVFYLREDVERWVLQNPVVTLDSYGELPDHPKS